MIYKMTHNLPFVSVCTPTFNRRHIIPIVFQCFKNQTYPIDRLEWIILDDGTDKIIDLINDWNLPQIRYYRADPKLTLGKKRNTLHSLAKGDIIVYFDDDDYYPPERISHAVTKLLENPDYLIAGAGEIYIYYKHLNKLYQCGPYSEYQATAATFAFRKELINITSYNEDDSVAEEKQFLKDFTIPMIQLDPLQTILVFAHDQNTFDKRKLLDIGQSKSYFKESNKTVSDFIRNEFEIPIRDFFINQLHDVVETYKLGDIKYKPDVVKQNKIIDKNIEQLKKQQTHIELPPISQIVLDVTSHVILCRPNTTPVYLNANDILNILYSYEKQLAIFSNIIKDKDDLLNTLKNDIEVLKQCQK